MSRFDDPNQNIYMSAPAPSFMHGRKKKAPIKPVRKKKAPVRPKKPINFEKKIKPNLPFKKTKPDLPPKVIEVKKVSGERQSKMMKAGLTKWGKKFANKINKASPKPPKPSKKDLVQKKKKPLFQKRKADTNFLEEVKESFFIFDFNGNGLIDKSIVKDMINDIGHEKRKEIMKIINEVKFIDYPCYEHIMMKYFTLPYTSTELKELMKNVSNDGDEFDLKDLKKSILTVSKNENIRIDSSDLDEILNGIGVNNRINIKKLCDEIGHK